MGKKKKKKVGERRSKHGETERERGSERERWKGRGRRGAAHPGRSAMCPIQTLTSAAHLDEGGRLKEDEQNML